MKMHYVIKLWEPAAPSFCSFDKMYIGSKQDILSAALNMEHDDAESETAKAVRVYYGGNHEAKHNIAYKEIPVLKPLMVNPWGSPKSAWITPSKEWAWPLNSLLIVEDVLYGKYSEVLANSLAT